MSIEGFGEITERLRRSTVLIEAGDRGGGSGVIWGGDGLIVTNAHVAPGSHARVQLWDGREFEAGITSRDPQLDLAALRLSANDLHAVTSADASKLRPGELAIAIGNPLGFVGALTTGIIHAVGPLRGFGVRTWVQANVRLAPGNSGGPLADASGRVIGVNTMVAGRLALAIPSNAVHQFLFAGPRGAWLGVTLHPVRVPRGNAHAFGLVVLEVEPGSRQRRRRSWLAIFCWARKEIRSIPPPIWHALSKRMAYGLCAWNSCAAIMRESAASPCRPVNKLPEGVLSLRDSRLYRRRVTSRS